MDINPKFIEQVSRIAASLDELDYYQILRLSADADADTIRRAYHAQARKFHPDRYRHFGHAILQKDLIAISKRVTEAYVTLRDDNTKSDYDALLRPNAGKNNLRYSEAHEEKRRTDSVEVAGKTPQGRKLFQAALEAWDRSDSQNALQNLKLARVYEPQNQRFLSVLEEWQSKAVAE